ncbi:hypothetical protein RCS94_07800 [Orbaceae bacterium ac157xtp]
MISPLSYGALSATSANTIHGSRPGFTGQSGAKKLGFKIGNTTYSESAGNLSTASGAINNFNAGLRLDEFEIMNLTASDFSPTADYADADGDLAHPTAAFSMSPRTFEWRDRTGALISTGDYNKTLGCGSNLNLPLTLKITLPDVKVRSRYGNPRESIETNLVQTYKIGSETGICFVKPNSLDWWSSNGTKNSGNATPSPTKGGGYTSDFDPSNGFKVGASTKFPTTGFPKASFALIMVGNASDYTFSSNDSAVTVNTYGTVSLNSKPSGAVTIKAIYNNDTRQVHYYTFNPTTVWVVPKRNPILSHGGYPFYETVKVICGGESNIPTRADLTNSPESINYTGIASNYYTRAVGGGVFGEWGETTGGNINYIDSQWVSSGGGIYSSPYWTREKDSSGYQFVVDSQNGIVIRGSGNFNYGVCLG